MQAATAGHGQKKKRFPQPDKMVQRQRAPKLTPFDGVAARAHTEPAATVAAAVSAVLADAVADAL